MTDERAMTNLMAQSLEAQEAYNAELDKACTALSELVLMLHNLRVGNMTTKLQSQAFVTAFAAQAQKFTTSVTRAAALLYEAQFIAAQVVSVIERNKHDANSNR